jgi:hypothetical protein
VTTRTCKQCGRPFEPKRPHQIYDTRECRYQGWIENEVEAASQRVERHPLVEVREVQEATKLKDRYSQVIYQGIIDRLERGPVHADDLEDLFPDSDRTMCRKLVGAQFGSLASRHYIREKERRKSSIASRKGAKSSVWEFTQKGRERLAGACTGTPHVLPGTAGPREQRSPGEAACSPAPSARSGETSTTTTGKGPAQSNGATLDRPASSHDDSPAGAQLLDDGVKGSSAALHEAVGEPTALPGLEERPRSAWTDPEMGEAA